MRLQCNFKQRTPPAIHQTARADKYPLGPRGHSNIAKRAREGLLINMRVQKPAYAKAVALGIQHLPGIGIMRPTCIRMGECYIKLPSICALMRLNRHNYRRFSGGAKRGEG